MVKKLTVLEKPSVLCPFSNSHVTVARCRKCSNFQHVKDEVGRGKKFTFNRPKEPYVICKWPY